MSKKENKTDQFENNDVTRQELEEMTRNTLPKGRVLVSGARFWNFDEEPEFKGTFLGSTVNHPTEGKVMGYDFVTDDGELVIVGATHSITKALDKLKADNYDGETRLYIRFEGKITLKDSGKGFNKYFVILLD